MNTVSFSDFQKLDIRIGTVIKAEVPQWSHWVMKLTVDFGGGIASEAKSAKDRSSRRVRTEPKSREGRSGGGDEIGIRTIFAGIMKFYKPEELVKKQFPFVINLEPKKMGPMGDVSEGMMMMAVEEPQSTLALRRRLTASRSQRARPRGSGVPADFLITKNQGSSEKSEEVPVLFKLWKKVGSGTIVR